MLTYTLVVLFFLCLYQGIGLWWIEVGIQSGSGDDVALWQLPDEVTGEPIKDPIAPQGVVPAGTPGTVNRDDHWMRNDASDIGGVYREIQDDDGGTVQYYTDSAACSIGSRFTNDYAAVFATDAGNMDGKSANGDSGYDGIIYARWFKTSCFLTPDVRRVYWYIYHRDTGGTETLLQSGFANVNTIKTKYTMNNILSTVSQDWATNERLVIKFRGYFEYGIE